MLALLAVATITPAYRIVDLGLPEGTASKSVEAIAINNRGEILVKAEGGFLWRNGRFIPLGPPTYQSDRDGGSTVEPRGLNNRSVVVGSMGNPGPIFMSGLSDIRAFVWKGGRTIDLGTGLSTEASHINDLGDWVGSGDHRGLIRLRGKVWSVGTLSHVPAGNFSSVSAINNRRVFVGTSTYGKLSKTVQYLPSRPFIADGNRFPFDLKPLRLPSGFSEGGGVDINEAGVILAFAYDPVKRSATPYLTHFNRTALLKLPERWDVPSRGDLNNRSDVVCTVARLDTQEDTKPQLWLEGRHVDFPQFPGWTIKTASGINDQGQICGTGIHEGKTRAYVLIPN